MNPTSLFFYDYETFGRDPRQDKIAQFAGVRTDLDLNIIEEPIIKFCQPSLDFLPEPEACLITGITPQIANNNGIPEYQFMRIIKNELGRKGTCHVGYNNISFDDEFSRFGFYKNFIDPYSHEWADNNSRMDALEILRLTYALRPEGINWPTNEEGKQSFKLEHLSVANGIEHENAHDAMSDVYATIEVLKLVKQHQPRLFDFALKMRNKKVAKDEIEKAMNSGSYLLKISPYVPVENGHLSFVFPICQDAQNNNAFLGYDLRTSPACLKDLDVEQLQEKMFKKKDEMEEGDERPGVVQCIVNKSHIYCDPRTLSPKRAEELGIDLKMIEAHKNQLIELLSDSTIEKKLKEVFNREFAPITDVDGQLYDQFINNFDRSIANRLTTVDNPELINHQNFKFRDERLIELLYRYKGRNFYNQLPDNEKEVFKSFCRSKVISESDNTMGIDKYRDNLSDLMGEHKDDPRALGILTALKQYTDQVEKKLN
ncbi:exodeoxyribonuclease I [Flammeovirga sp. MY04]|uniref:exodeoxyribonuclease I n=1 Tax=Flammeovirga sp. MY04 TaxID=1191459 RepID=UPI000806111B|nr:exodeoxyribonuclease I [Flammeovirga sp. MY04]ANQ52484.1 exodeoxyribonuclease I [Flammeovirga sp. MY04]